MSTWQPGWHQILRPHRKSLLELPQKGVWRKTYRNLFSLTRNKFLSFKYNSCQKNWNVFHKNIIPVIKINFLSKEHISYHKKISHVARMWFMSRVCIWKLYNTILAILVFQSQEYFFLSQVYISCYKNIFPVTRIGYQSQDISFTIWKSTKQQ